VQDRQIEECRNDDSRCCEHDNYDDVNATTTSHSDAVDDKTTTAHASWWTVTDNADDVTNAVDVTVQTK